MPCTTYLHDGDVAQMAAAEPSLGDTADYLAEVREKTGKDWRVEVTHHVRPRLFRRPEEWDTYCLFTHGVGPEWQVITAAAPTLRHVDAYLLGVLTGLRYAT